MPEEEINAEACCDNYERCEYVRDFGQENCCVHDGTYDISDANKWCPTCQDSLRD